MLDFGERRKKRELCGRFYRWVFLGVNLEWILGKKNLFFSFILNFLIIVLHKFTKSNECSPFKLKWLNFLRWGERLSSKIQTIELITLSSKFQVYFISLYVYNFYFFFTSYFYVMLICRFRLPLIYLIVWYNVNTSTLLWYITYLISYFN